MHFPPPSKWRVVYITFRCVYQSSIVGRSKKPYTISMIITKEPELGASLCYCAVFCEAHLRVMGSNDTLYRFRLQSESPMPNTKALGRDSHTAVNV